jgi:hypothetical protein
MKQRKIKFLRAENPTVSAVTYWLALILLLLLNSYCSLCIRVIFEMSFQFSFFTLQKVDKILCTGHESVAWTLLAEGNESIVESQTYICVIWSRCGLVG